MGTEIEFTINLLATRAQKNSIDLTFVGGLEHIEDRGLWRNSREVGTDCQLLEPMDRRLNRNSIESIKMTMQKHEDTFKQQVLELHRLYNVQKLLMDEFRNEFKQKKLRPPIMNSVGFSKSAFIDNHHQPTKQTGYELDFRLKSTAREDDLCSTRDGITGANSGETRRMTVRRGFNVERPAEENSSPRIPRTLDEDRMGGPSSSNMATIMKRSTVSIEGCDYDDSQVELTLSIGGCETKKRAKSHQQEVACSDSHSTGSKELHYYSSASFKSDRAEECSDLTNPISSSSVTFDQERKKPHWLFQGLNLK